MLSQISIMEARRNVSSGTVSPKKMKEPINAFTIKLQSLLLDNANQVISNLQKIQNSVVIKLDDVLDATNSLRTIREQIDRDLVDLKEIQQGIRSMDRIDSLELALEALIPLVNQLSQQGITKT